MGEGKVGFTVNRLSKTLDGLKYRKAPMATEEIVRKPGSRIRRTKENKVRPHDGTVREPIAEK